MVIGGAPSYSSGAGPIRLLPLWLPMPSQPVQRSLAPPQPYAGLAAHAWQIRIPPRPARSLAADQSWAPPDWDRLGTELAVAPLGKGALLVGRPALRWLPSELVRLQHLAAVAATVTTG